MGQINQERGTYPMNTSFYQLLHNIDDRSPSDGSGGGRRRSPSDGSGGGRRSPSDGSGGGRRSPSDGSGGGR